MTIETMTRRASEPCVRRAAFRNVKSVETVVIERADEWRMEQGTALQSAVLEHLRRWEGLAYLEHDQDEELLMQFEDGLTVSGHPDAWRFQQSPGEPTMAQVVEVKTTSADALDVVCRAAQGFINTGISPTTSKQLDGYLLQMRVYVALAVVNGYKPTPPNTIDHPVDPYYATLAIAARDASKPAMFRFRLFDEDDDHRGFLRWFVSKLEPLLTNEKALPHIPQGFARWSPPCRTCEFKALCWTERPDDSAGHSIALETYRNAQSEKDEAVARFEEARADLGQILDASGEDRLDLRVEFDHPTPDGPVRKALPATISWRKGTARRATNYKALEADGVADKYVKLGAIGKPSLNVNFKKEIEL